MIYIRLLGNRVHVRRMKSALKSDGGIHLTERYQDDRAQYLVLGTGPGRKLKNGTILPMEVKAGDYVLIPWMQDSVTLSDETIVVNASQIWAKWEAHEEAALQSD